MKKQVPVFLNRIVLFIYYLLTMGQS